MKKRLTALLLALLCLTGCGGSAGGPQSLTPEPHPPALQPLPEESAAALSEFSLALLRENWTGKNILLSPLSVLSALGMTANGAEGTTREQMEAVLGLPVEELNETLAAWRAGLPEEAYCRVDLANSLWLRDDESFEANPDFLQTAADWYEAEVFLSSFDSAAVRDINRWVEKNTHGMIGGILDEIPDSAVMYLINALALEAEWANIYRETQVLEDRIFTTEDGREQSATLMYSTERFYLQDGGVQGFLKPYQGGRWAFAALLPEEGATLEDTLASLTGERLRKLLAGAEKREVHAAIPKFQCEYGAELSESLQAMGMTDAFAMERAQFDGMGSSSMGPLFISRVLHKTYISVDEKGTQAGAATAVEAAAGTAGPEEPDPVPVVCLDRPFLYLLVDMEMNLPAFIGAVTSLD